MHVASMVPRIPVALAASFAAAVLGAGPATPIGAATAAFGSPITVGANAKAEYVLARSRPSVRISTTSSIVTARGKAPIDLICPAGAPGACRGTVTIELPSRTRGGSVSRSLGSARYEVQSGRKIRVFVHLNSYGRRRLVRHKPLRATATATTIRDGHTATAARTITVRPHTPRHGHRRAQRSR
jgi:hypothetical protein